MHNPVTGMQIAKDFDTMNKYANPQNLKHCHHCPLVDLTRRYTMIGMLPPPTVLTSPITPQNAAALVAKTAVILAVVPTMMMSSLVLGPLVLDMTPTMSKLIIPKTIGTLN